MILRSDIRKALKKEGLYFVKFEEHKERPLCIHFIIPLITNIFKINYKEKRKQFEKNFVYYYISIGFSCQFSYKIFPIFECFSKIKRIINRGN